MIERSFTYTDKSDNALSVRRERGKEESGQYDYLVLVPSEGGDSLFVDVDDLDEFITALWSLVPESGL